MYRSKQGRPRSEQSYLGPHCLSKRLLKHFSRREEQTTFVAIGALRVKEEKRLEQSPWGLRAPGPIQYNNNKTFIYTAGPTSSPAKVSSYLPFDKRTKRANRNPWYDKMPDQPTQLIMNWYLLLNDEHGRNKYLSRDT